MVKQKIAEYVEKSGIKQVYLSQKTGIPPQSISLLLRGERSLDVEEYAAIWNCQGKRTPKLLEKS